MNMLRADGSVRWAEDSGEDSFLALLVAAASDPAKMRLAWGDMQRQIK